MFKQDYTLILDVLQDEQKKGTLSRRAYEILCNSLGEAFAEDNPRFNFALWEELCRKV
jgi:hypothetical protein